MLRFNNLTLSKYLALAHANGHVRPLSGEDCGRPKLSKISAIPEIIETLFVSVYSARRFELRADTLRWVRFLPKRRTASQWGGR